jgi:hypothetical protein
MSTFDRPDSSVEVGRSRAVGMDGAIGGCVPHHRSRVWRDEPESFAWVASASVRASRST